MTVLCDWEITEWAQNGGITPFDEMCVNPASIDLRWSGRWRVALSGNWSNEMVWDELVMRPGDMCLLDTMEVIKVAPTLAGTLMLKSSMGRRGLEHLHAGWFDPGFHGTGTLELKNLAPWPIHLKRGQRILQLALMRMSAVPLRDYSQTGRYVGQSGPTEAR